ncbi:hypothetical protein NEOLEDRAFT_1139578 [Neolentinus lepideus HHB14362 ss-1]|uniref:Uncharacterized protein n=1 Tax=Neolentinus lepideus HHB14362 ss-1 TaxID=1314782 RepID=A0A165PN67_9AGAM|nr:hypothetical protein NEOLEDRAFT_1139578 [Neolentinus lepideus HHB14362 ss-1]
MFSTWSSFLPTVGNNAAAQASKHIVKDDERTLHAPEQDKPKMREQSVDEMGARKKKERANETFIIVRPPPSKSNHPLNLQVQLVPPNPRDRSSVRRSLDMSSSEPFDASDETSQLSRTTSGRSDTASVYSSAYSSVASLSSMASSSSTLSGRRLIIPLYNLQAHNVMTNIVVDAGTDAKVTRFGKRGMEVIGLAVIEPVEVFGSHASLAAGLLAPGSGRTSLEGGARALPGSSRGHTPELPHTPGSSNLSLSDVSHHPRTAQPISIIENPPATTPTPSGPKKLFGKFFKGRKEMSPVRVDRNVLDSSVQSPPATPATPSTPMGHMRSNSITRKLSVPGGSSKRSSLMGPIPQDQNVIQATVLLQPAILGIQPRLSAPTYPPIGRPSMYVWIVRRWLKGADSGLVSNMMGMLDRKQESVGLAADQVELRFEWKRGTPASKRAKRKSSRKSRPMSAQGASPDRRAGSVISNQGLSETGERLQASKREKRLSTVDSKAVSRRRSVDSHRSITSRGGLGDDSQSFVTDTAEDDHDGDDGEDSDPEDSETSWVCTVAARRIGIPTSYTSMYSPTKGLFDLEGHGGKSEEEVKVKVAQLKPTPHHPKVISLLKMPYPLPDIEVERLHVRKRVLTPSGVARPTSSSGPPNREGNGTGKSSKGFFAANGVQGPQTAPALVLTAEEIKDVVSSTAMWLIVREGIGGVGKVTRKGDGWRIRA